MRVLNVEQGIPEWYAARCGMVTASRIKDVLADKKTAAYRNYRAELVAEILTGNPQESDYQSPEMLWGKEWEIPVRDRYAEIRGWPVEQIGLIYHPTIERGAASPDGLVEFDGMLEIKCPKTATFIQYVMDDEIPTIYRPQMFWQMACSGKKWVDFMAFDPRMPYDSQVFIKRLMRDPKEISRIEQVVLDFVADVESVVARFRGPHA